MVTYDDLMTTCQQYGLSNDVAAKVLEAIRDVFLRSGDYDGTHMLNAMIEPGLDDTEGGAV